MPETPPAQLDSRSRELAAAVPDITRRELEEYPNVIGTGFGYRTVQRERRSEVALICYVQEKIADQDLRPQERLPKTVTTDTGETIQLDVREVGQWDVDAGSPTRGQRVRPVVGGVEVSASAGTATITGLFETRTGEQRLLTARHILRDNQDVIGRSIRQPTDGDIIGEVSAAHTFITDSGTRRNLLDTVLIRPDNEYIATGQYLGWHDAAGTGRPSIGDRVIAFTAGGGISGGTVVARDVDATLGLDGGGSARYGGLVEYDWGGASRSSGAAVGRIDETSREMEIVGQHVGSGAGSSLMTPWTTIERQFGHLTPVSDFYEPAPAGDVGDGGGGGGGTGATSTAVIRVEDSSGNPIQGATVTVEQLDTISSSATIRVVDGQGNPIRGASVTIEQS